ncbi:hypothetical protein FDB55_03320 [Clostridium botulinum]|nr:hypothetical protein [Clostridium botulinum]NFN20778.1 hypothetical protein [Clostridium botulinum]NFN41996.1 hypothetical protein [Clostridium botulinum]
MAIMYHQMKYIPSENKYVITKLKPSRNIDTTKIEGVAKYSTNMWVGRRKQDLVDYAEKLKVDLIENYQKKLNMLINRSIEAKNG